MQELTFRKRVSLTKRGYMTIHEMFPGYISWMIFQKSADALLPFINIYLSGLIITALATKKTLNELLILVAITVSGNLLCSLVSKIATAKISCASGSWWIGISEPLNNKTRTMDYSYVENPEIHELKSGISVRQRSNGLGMSRLIWLLGSILQSFFTIVFSVALVVPAFATSTTQKAGAFSFLFSPWCSVAVVAIIITCVLLEMYRTARLSKAYMEVSKGFESLNRNALYYFNILRNNYKMGKDLKLYNMQNTLSNGINTLLAPIKDMLGRISTINSRSGILGSILSNSLTAVMYLYVSLKALFGAFGVGSIVQYVGALGQFGQGLSTLVSSFTQIYLNCDALAYFFEYIDLPSTKYQGTLPVEKRNDNEYEIEFHNVSFKYPGSDSYSIRELSMKLHIGQKLAVVGKNGSGKTTMIKLLCRLYDPTEGQITLNGIDIKKYNYDDYLAIFSVVFQDFKLFSLPLGQNIAASMQVDEKRAQKCLEMAGIGDRFENGLNTHLYKDFEEDGIEVSGGEAQKIALARALYKEAPFIILDEPTAALDPIAEFDVYNHFNTVVADRTTVFISHRLSSCRFCNDIAVFDNGKLIQRGSHDSLISNTNGIYHSLWNAQSQYYE